MEANPPPGMWAATGQAASKAPSLADIRRGSYGSEGWNDGLQQRNRVGSRASQGDDRTPASPVDDASRPNVAKRMSSANTKTPGLEPFPALAEENTHQVTTFNAEDKDVNTAIESTHSSETAHHSDGDASQQLGRTPSGGVS